MKKINFKMWPFFLQNLMTHCSATRPQNNFYGKPNQKRKQELRNIAYSSRSESAKKEGALDFDPKEKSNQQTRRATKRSSRAKRAPATGKQGRAGKVDLTHVHTYAIRPILSTFLFNYHQIEWVKFTKMFTQLIWTQFRWSYWHYIQRTLCVNYESTDARSHLISR